MPALLPPTSRAASTAAAVLVSLLASSATGCVEGGVVLPEPPTDAPEAHGPGHRLPVEHPDPSSLPVVEAVLGVPPLAAPPTGRDAPAVVVVEIEVVEVSREIADGVTYTFWTFGGTVPGPMVRVRRGDYVELHLMNHPSSTMPHNIDLHAVTGPGGGATSSFTAPGHQTQFTFQALNEGVYVYHCATAPVGMHVANGMYGLIVVEPDEGFPAVDHEYYVVQGDFYTPGEFREPGIQPFDLDRAIHEDPSYVLFNGRDGALTGEGALTADTGDRVRIFVGNGGPNLTSSFHVIGEIFDRVATEGGTAWNTDVQTTSIPPGGAAIVELGVEVPGDYVLVDHALFRAFHHGAVGMMHVEGDPVPRIYSGLELDSPYVVDAGPPVDAGPGDDRLVRGEATFLGVCAGCHQRDGAGLAPVYPPLASSDYLMADRERSIRIVLGGLSGPIVVNGTTYNGAMPALALSDYDVASVLTYVRASWGNDGDAIDDTEVAAVRATLGP